jgi:hypothetical protein
LRISAPPATFDVTNGDVEQQKWHGRGQQAGCDCCEQMAASASAI